jgi:hypothetical protein
MYRARYSGASIDYPLASIIAGGPAPFISTWLFATYQSTIPIGIYVTVCAIVSIIATALLPDYTTRTSLPRLITKSRCNSLCPYTTAGATRRGQMVASWGSWLRAAG